MGGADLTVTDMPLPVDGKLPRERIELMKEKLGASVLAETDFVFQADEKEKGSRTAVLINQTVEQRVGWSNSLFIGVFLYFIDDTDR